MDDPARHIARLSSLSVLFVMATEQEFGPHLKSKIAPLITGVGPVEAAVATSAALGALAAAQNLPDLVFSLGSAGSRKLDHAEIYQLSGVCYRDMDCSPLGFVRGVTPFLNEPAEIAIPHQISGIPAASIASGATIVSGKAYDAIAADMVDMESYAVYRAARRFGVPMIGLRGITDGKTDLARYEDWADYLAIIDEKLGAALDHFSGEVVAGRFRLHEAP